jgi:hypothetical protein
MVCFWQAHVRVEEWKSRKRFHSRLGYRAIGSDLPLRRGSLRFLRVRAGFVCTLDSLVTQRNTLRIKLQRQRKLALFLLEIQRSAAPSRNV